MTDVFRHEQAYRSREAMNRIAGAPVFIFGVGALGSNIAVGLVRSGFTNIGYADYDRVASHNINTQAYSGEEVGLRKTDALMNLLYQITDDLKIESYNRKLETEEHVIRALKPFPSNILMVDTFDNAKSRQLLVDTARNRKLDHLLHVGVNGDFGEVKWNERYIVPSGQGEDICEYPLANAFVQFMSAIAIETIIRFVLTGAKQSGEVTFGDYRVIRS